MNLAHFLADTCVSGKFSPTRREPSSMRPARYRSLTDICAGVLETHRQMVLVQAPKVIQYSWENTSLAISH